MCKADRVRNDDVGRSGMAIATAISLAKAHLIPSVCRPITVSARITWSDISSSGRGKPHFYNRIEGNIQA